MQTKFTTRKAVPADIPVIKKLAEATWGPTYLPILTKEQVDYMFDMIYTEDALRQQMLNGQSFLLLYKNNTPIGFASYSLKDPTLAIYKLNKIYLVPSCQGTGAGRFLLQQAELYITEAGGNMVDLNVNRYNKAKNFYERCGYTVFQEEDIPIGPYWMNDYVMRKQL